jgi:hypothetical protein
MDERRRQGPRAGGWRQWTPERARRELEAWRASGESLAAFARRRRFSSQRLRWWRDRLAQWSGDGEGRESPRLVPVAVAAPVAPGAPAVTLHLPGGPRVEVEDVAAVPPVWLATFVLALGREEE